MHSFIEKNKLLLARWAIIITGTCIWSVTMVKSGLSYGYGVGFWGANGHDAVWHIAIINSLSIPSLNMPIFSGTSIQNYHLGFDALVAIIHRVTSIPISILYFQIFPPIMAFLIGFLVYKFVLGWQKSTTAAWWATFFVYFGTGFGWILDKGDSIFWSQQSLSTLINPPFALSLVVILIGLIALQSKRYVIAAICFGLLVEIKVYAGILALAGLFLSSFRHKQHLVVLCISSLIAIPLFLLTNSKSSELVMIQPGWFLEALFAPDRINLPRFFSALNTYRVGGIWLKAIPAFGVAFVIFLVGNLGSRLLGLISMNDKSWQGKMFIWIIVLGATIPMIFIQKGTPWNTIQFFYYSLFFVGIFSGVTIARLFNKLTSKAMKVILCSLLISVAWLEISTTLKNYIPNRPPAMVSTQELTALNYLSNQPRGVVLTFPFDKSEADKAISNPPRPLSLYESTAYVSAFSGQTTFMEDEVNLHITNYSVLDRKKEIIDFFQKPTKVFIDKNQIKYVYLTDNQRKKINTNFGAKEIFSNEAAAIWEF